MSESVLEIMIRGVQPSDHAFIYATWLRQLWFSADTTTTLHKQVFMRVNHNLIEKVLKEDRVLVASLKEDPDVILGYAAFEDRPYVYVKKVWREAGVDQLLLRSMQTLKEQDETKN